MKTLSRALFLAFLSLLLALLPAVTAYASPPMPASGIWEHTAVAFTDVRHANGNTFITLFETVAFTGTLEGTCTGEEKLEVHPNGRFTGRGVETCNFTVGEASGTVELLIVFSGDPTSVEGITGKFVILSGTDDLANLRGQIPFQTPTGDDGTYSGQIHFDP